MAVQQPISRALHPLSHERVDVASSRLCGVAEFRPHPLLVALEPRLQLGRLVAPLQNAVGLDRSQPPERRAEEGFAGVGDGRIAGGRAVVAINQVIVGLAIRRLVSLSRLRLFRLTIRRLQRERIQQLHIHLNEPLVAQAVGERVVADLGANLVHREGAHVERLPHELRPSGEVAGQERRRVELDEVVAVLGDQVAAAGELPAAGVRVKTEGDEVDRRLLDRAVPDIGQVAEHMQRHPIAPGDLLDGVAARVDQSAMLVVDRVGFLVEAVGHDHGSEGFHRAAVGVVPLLLEPQDGLGLEGLIRLDVGAALRAVAKERGRVQFRRPRQADRVLR